MDAPLEPRRRVIREEAVYEPIPQVVPQPVVGQPVVGVQPVVHQVAAQPVYEVQQPVVAAQPVYQVQQPVMAAQPVVQQPVVGYNPVTGQPVVQTVLPQPIISAQPVYEVQQQVVAAQPVVYEAAPAVDTQRSYSQVGDMRVENVRQGFYDANGNLVERQEQILDDPYMRRMNKLDRTARIIYFVMGLVEVLLALRFLFRVIGAEASNGLVSFIYNLTGAFVGPFNGIFNDQSLQKGNVIEISTLLAMALYAILTYGIIQLLYLLLTPNRSSRSVFSSTRRRGL